MIATVRNWVREKIGTELPCGCIAPDGRGARFSNATTVVDLELNTLHVEKYRNCTKYNREWVCTIQCDHCEAEWTDRHRAGSRVDYGDPNPEADRELETKHRPSLFHQSVVSYNDKPVVEQPE